MDRKILQDLEGKRRIEEEGAKERMMKVKKQRRDVRSKAGDKCCLSELRILLLGNRFAGKSSAGNIILGGKKFDLNGTSQCVKRQVDIAGRLITVVKGPEWWPDTPVEEFSEILKREILLSVSLCPPAPHAVILVIRADTVFEEKNRKNIQERSELLTDSVWSHTIVLFTHGDCLGDTPIEQHIESEGKELQWLVEKCGNRYHVLNNENRSDDTQVTELLEKIEEMVAANSGQLFQFPCSVQKGQITLGKGYPGMYEHQNMKREQGSDDRFLESSHFGSTYSITSSNSSGYGSLFSIPGSVLQRPNSMILSPLMSDEEWSDMQSPGLSANTSSTSQLTDISSFYGSSHSVAS
ncbi:GTPase IMAP family member 9-like [Colossoma macropomum]|uniref:GTPase IMAP family member 9-like n=1 Tax=Colossoma macropomum TaxID=42526 RepID=UPI001864C175|nr:GTPase IMAP family member 9-like [Colossoma macropomum]